MENLSPEKIAQIKDLLGNMEDNMTNQSLIQDNKIIFTFDNSVYRCHMPNQRIQSEAEDYQNKIKIRLLKDEDAITRKQLIKVLKEKQDIDIYELEDQKEKLKKDLQDCYLDLAVTTSEREDKLDELKDKKQKIEDEFMKVSIEIADYLTPCTEERIVVSYYRYLTYACTEKSVPSDVSGEEKWAKVWKNFEDYENDDSGLSYKALNCVHTLLLNVKEK